MEKLFCPQCGAKLEPGVKFCGSCGSSLNENELMEPVKVNTGRNFTAGSRNAFDQAMKKLQENDWDGLKKIITAELFVSDGRISRGEYIKKFLFLLVSIIPLLIIFVFLVEFLGDFVEGILTLLFGIVMVLINISYLMLSIRRLHDLNKSGWLILIAIVPLIDIAFFIYLLACQGTRGNNDYGAEPEQ